MMTPRDWVREVLKAHLMTPFGQCLCGFELAEIDDHASWTDHVAAVISTASPIQITLARN